MENGKEAIEKIEQLVDAARVVTIDGKPWSAKTLSRVIFEPMPAPVKVKTLTGIKDFLAANLDMLDLAELVAHVEDIDKVSVFSPLEGEKRVRAIYVEAELDEKLDIYPFGEYLQVERFVIAMRSLFEPSTDTERVIAYVSKVSGGETFGLEDDGITQVATVKKGVSGAVTAQESAPVIVKLRPFRTFREIQQTESEFLLRMKLVNTEKQIVGIALFEADGGRWRNDTVVALRAFLSTEIPDLKVIA